MRRVVLILCVWLGGIVLAVMLMDTGSNRDRQHVGMSATQRRHYRQQLALLRSVERQYQQHQYLTALTRLERQRSLFRDDSAPAQLSLAYYLLKGKLHWSLWEFVEAEQAWHLAQAYAHSASQQAMLTRLRHDSQRVVNDINRERNNRQVYLASPHVGPAGELQGRIALIYIFVVDAGRNGWSLRERDYVMTTWKSTQAWLQARARQYGHSVSFIARSFLVNRNPQIKRLRVGDVSNRFRNVEQVVNLLARQLGYRDLLQFTRTIKQQEHADEAMVLLQLARDGRSFASRCLHSCSPHGEFAVLLESPHGKKWQSLQYAQAHESLHLFGADDLYNIRGAKYYEVRDIMNYPSSLLQASTLDKLTAWAVGLDAHKPKAPFRIKAAN